MICIAALMINLSDHPWQAIDYANKRAAMVRCGELYPDAPCLKTFIKKDVRVYNAVCGNKRKDNR